MNHSGLSGTEGEKLARKYLEDHGYRHIASNWRCKAGELDLIMWAPPERQKDWPVNRVKFQKFFHGSQKLNAKGKILVVVEVRSRRPTTFGQANETVTWQKQRKIIRATQWYQQHTDYWGEIRFDVIAIKVLSQNETQIEHITDAFSA